MSDVLHAEPAACPPIAMHCLTDDDVLEFAAGALSPQQAAVVDSHIDACPTCRTLVSDAVRGDGEDALGTLGRYELCEVLGRGGMGVVYRAYDPDLHRHVAIKLLVAADQHDRDAQLREARALAQIAHPNVLAVYDVGTVDDAVFMAMELVDGDSLLAWCAQPHARTEVLAVMRQVGAGLVAAHAAGLVHGDIKPANIVITPNGRVVVIDFGLARARRQRASGGTPGYMPPEQAHGAALDERADQYGFCKTLLVALGGSHASPAAIRPRRLARVIERGLSDDPAERFPSMAALLAALGPWRRRWWAAAAAGAALAAIAIAIVVTRTGERAPAAKADAGGSTIVGGLAQSLPANTGTWIAFGTSDDPDPAVVARDVRARLGACVAVELAPQRAHYRLDDCQLPLGARVTGDITVTYRHTADAVIADVAAPSLLVHGGRADYSARVELRGGDFTLSGQTRGVGARGVPYVTTWKSTGTRDGDCERFDGGWTFHAAGAAWTGEFRELELCGAACPRARDAHFVASGGPAIRLHYDGSRVGRWSTADRSGTFLIRCTPRSRR